LLKIRMLLRSLHGHRHHPVGGREVPRVPRHQHRTPRPCWGTAVRGGARRTRGGHDSTMVRGLGCESVGGGRCPGSRRVDNCGQGTGTPPPHSLPPYTHLVRGGGSDVGVDRVDRDLTRRASRCRRNAHERLRPAGGKVGPGAGTNSGGIRVEERRRQKQKGAQARDHVAQGERLIQPLTVCKAGLRGREELGE
jgi:hypothetical protein